jgi:hypothetical protein
MTNDTFSSSLLSISLQAEHRQTQRENVSLSACMESAGGDVNGEIPDLALSIRRSEKNSFHIAQFVFPFCGWARDFHGFSISSLKGVKVIQSIVVVMRISASSVFLLLLVRASFPFAASQVKLSIHC